MELSYNSQKHKIQVQVNNLSKQQKIDYIKNQWVSEKFKSKDLIATNNSQACQHVLMDPKSMFIKKFLNQRNKRLQQDSEDNIPQVYLDLLESEIFNNNFDNNNIMNPPGKILKNGHILIAITI
jgi:hypothetical protein